MPESVALVLLVLAAAALLALGVRIVYRARRDPREREKRRRLAVHAHGRLADGTITEADDVAIFYSYSVGGVEYATSQDVAELREAISMAPEQMIGCPVTVKYAMRNPANSIVICEEWSGLRPGAPAARS